MSLSNELEFIGHIKFEVDFILNAMENVDERAFDESPILKRAVTRALEIIGEATKNLDPDFKNKYYSIPWKFMAGMRDKLIHDYMGVDYKLVYLTATQDIPELHFQIEQIIADHKI